MDRASLFLIVSKFSTIITCQYVAAACCRLEFVKPRGRKKIYKGEERREKTKEGEDKLKDIISVQFLVRSPSLVLCVIAYAFLRQGGALINEQSGAIVRALNYFSPVVFQKQGSNREENTESNAS